MTDVFSNMPQVGVQSYQPSTVSSKAHSEVAAPAAAVASAPQQDTVQLSQVKPKRRGPIKTVKEAIANFKKFFATAGEYIKGGFRGLVVGGSLGAITYSIGDLINKHRAKVAEKAGAEGFKKVPNKALAAVLLVGSLAVNLWNSSLNASEKRSDIEHRWTGHKK